jgi:hypothetical protein
MTEPPQIGGGPEMASSGTEEGANSLLKRSRNTSGCPIGYRRRFCCR